MIIDYYKEGFKIIGPGTSVTREFSQKIPQHNQSLPDGLSHGLQDNRR